MNRKRCISFRAWVILWFAAVAFEPAFAVPTPYAPDAWSRGNNATTSYFGWDFFETTGPPNLGSLWVLDDSTPDLGTGIAAAFPRIYQGADGLEDPSPNAEGHVSSTGNYYSFTETFDATIRATAPGGAGGFTTVVLQLHATAGGGGPIRDLSFAMVQPAAVWTQQKHLHNTHADGLGYHWLEWTAPGGNLPFFIHIASTRAHRAVDSFEIDTYWSASGPVVNAIRSVPEPATGGSAALFLLCGLAAGRVWRRGPQARAA
jgi:hypothetical protein